MSDRQVLITETYLEDIADGIREVNGTENEYTPSQMKAAIVATKKTLVSKTITENDTYDPADDDADGYSSVTVNVSGGSPTLITKTITANDTYNAADDNADGYSSVIVNVPSGGGGDTFAFVHINTVSGCIAYATDGVQTAYPPSEYAGQAFQIIALPESNVSPLSWDVIMTVDENIYTRQTGSFSFGSIVTVNMFEHYAGGTTAPTITTSSGNGTWYWSGSTSLGNAYLQYPDGYTGNKSARFQTAIPAYANQLTLDIYTKGVQNNSWSTATLVLTSTVNDCGEYGGGSSTVRSLALAARNTTAENMNANKPQWAEMEYSNMTGSGTARGVGLARQTIKIDISDISVPIYVNFHDYGATVYVYSIDYI